MRCTACGTVLGPDEKFCGKCGAPRPQLEARFVEAQRRFTELSTRHEAGQLDEATYAVELQELYLEDGAGGYWMSWLTATSGIGTTVISGFSAIRPWPK